MNRKHYYAAALRQYHRHDVRQRQRKRIIRLFVNQGLRLLRQEAIMPKLVNRAWEEMDRQIRSGYTVSSPKV